MALWSCDGMMLRYHNIGVNVLPSQSFFDQRCYGALGCVMAGLLHTGRNRGAPASALDTELVAAEARRAEQAPTPDSMDLYFRGWRHSTRD